MFKNFTAAILFDLRSPRVLRDASHATNNRTNTTGVITFIVSNGELPLVHLITEGHVPVREQRIDSWHINTSSVRHPPLPRVFIVKLDFPHDWNIKPVAHYNHWQAFLFYVFSQLRHFLDKVLFFAVNKKQGTWKKYKIFPRRFINPSANIY